MTEFPLVSIISVNYNSAEVTADMIRSLNQISYPNIEIVIVDNASTHPPDELKQQFPEIIYIKSNENLGFAGGNNLGIASAKGKYFLLLNNDTEVHPHFLEPLVAFMEKDSSVGCVSSKLIYHHTPGLIQYAGNTGFNVYTGQAFSRGYKETDQGQYDDIIPIKIAHGAAMMFSRKVLDTIGPMADIYFLYYEEVDYCKRILDAGFKMYYVGTSTVYHKESISTGKNSPLKEYYLTRNRLLFIRRNLKGIQKLASSLFFILFAVPKGIFLHLIKGDFSRLNALWKGVYWHLSHLGKT
ncbi:MAG: dTDP-Rha--alpha-D-GlcNAc-pyrophosphate polyprenol alpha-3-L-rhamnosyltransferase [Crocinitomicaceae bacterium]|nr:dTDP-Rha--alpha-D-GlcNAc-pyrophosphate polyprenol alpha-3-L-rhamnosyltransferase [Crocinitomicaceae bacterium]|tara:strand:- start:52 stop:942 length:891 start_codon:yes stop_codon:yes gene_type:complete